MDTTILLRRSQNLGTAANVQLRYGEPLYTDDQYFTVGNENESLVSQRNVIRLVPKAQADSQLYYTINSSNKVVINSLNGTTLTPVITFGTAAEKDITSSVSHNNQNAITSGAVYTVKTNLQNSINNVQSSVQSLQSSLSSLLDKPLDNTVAPNSENPVTAGAVYTFVTQAITEAFNNYRPWTTSSSDTKKFYINDSTGLQYHNGSKWVTTPVGYT